MGSEELDIRVGGLVFTIKPDPLLMSEGSLYGETKHISQQIVYSSEVPWDRQQETILHEVIHVVLSAFGPPLESRSDEDIARVVGRALHQVFVDNPELLKFLYGGE